jgi:hypothetical protein
MEAENKQEYFQFYNSKSPKQSRLMKTRQQFRRYENIKLLPHIAEEYNFRITNHLLIKKIISPKRDKIIVQSL